MKNAKGVISLLLAVLLLLLGACGKRDGDGDTDDSNMGAELYSIIENGSSEYVIVVPAANTAVFSKAYALSQTIESATGVLLKVVQDTYAEQSKEILVGITSRNIQSELTSELTTPDDYAIVKSEEKIIIYGGTPDAVDGAIAYFSENFINGAEKGALAVPATLSYIYHSPLEYITVDDSYRIVANAEDMDYAETLCDMLSKKIGLSLKTVSSDVKAQKKEIVIGDARRKAATELENGITSPFEGVLAVSDLRVMLVCGNSAALGSTVEYFGNVLCSSLFRGQLMLSSEYFAEHSFGEELAADILSQIKFGNISLDGYADTEVSRVYTPDGTDSAWYYSHHPFMTVFNGKYYIFYSSGRRNEDDCGQRIMMAVSDDFKNWNVSVLVDSIQGDSTELVLYAKGLYVYNGVLTVYYHGYEYSPEVIREQTDKTCEYPYLRPLDVNVEKTDKYELTYYIQTSDGVNWTDAVSLGNVYGGNISPKQYATADGKDILLWAGYGSLSYSEDLSGVGTWKNIRLKLGTDIKVNAITESSIYQLSDGTFVHMSRTNGGTQLASASFDGGKTWTEMQLSACIDYSAKFEYGTLPDGRYYYLGNLSYGRAELVLMTSENGTDFNNAYYLGSDNSYKQQKTGLYKGGAYGYPTSYFDEEYMYICYSIEKEAIGVMRVKLSSIGVK